jgi:hypothetical protein
MIMGSSTKASDWEVMPKGEINVASVTVWYFDFRSEAADYSRQFFFSGIGLGLGGIITAGSDKYTSLTCKRDFSANDLDWSAGTVLACGAAVIVGAGTVIISARTFSGSLFEGQRCSGITVGIGVEYIGAKLGMWKKL